MVDSIYLSPHLDDVALSCGGQIHQLTHRPGGQEVLIVTLMAGVPPPGPVSAFAREQHVAWGFAADEPDHQEIGRVVVEARRADRSSGADT